MSKPASKRALKKAMRVLHVKLSTMDVSLYSDLKSMEDRLRCGLHSEMKLLADQLRHDLKAMETRILCAVRVAALSRVPYRDEADVLR